ncbi:MAG: GGDEF domain-containing protein [Terracidiphilus sp.]|jgi:diguanylate cyclase (GGDEF)-like protein
MKRWTPAGAIVLCWASVAWASAPAPLTTLRAIHALSNAEASQELPVAFEATVTYFRGYENTLFVQDGDDALYIWSTTGLKLIPGDRILVEGKTHADFSPNVHSEKITLLRHGALPKPLPTSFDELIRGRNDCLLVTVRAVVRAANLARRSITGNASLPMVTTIRLQLVTESGGILAFIDSDDAGALSGLLDAEVEITGVAGGLFDGKMQQTGVLLHISSLAGVKVLKRAAVSSRSLPVTPMDKVLAGYRMHDLTERVRVHGTITYYSPDTAVVLQNGSKSLWIATNTTSGDLRINDEADATGFADVHSGFLTLTDGEIWDSNEPANVSPQPATWKQLTSSSHPFDLVSTEGEVVTEVREPKQDEYVLSSDGQLFGAIYGHLNGVGLPMKQIPVGARVRVTGICILENSNPFNKQVPFDILLRSPDDIAIIAKPSLLTVRNLMLVLNLMLLVVIAVGGWGWTLRRKVRMQTGALAKRIEAEAALERRTAQLEQKRSRILEDINGSRPLAEILEEITELVSFMLNDAPCWCEVADGARLGNCPPDADPLRVLVEEIPARSGPALGNILAAFDPEATPAAGKEALSVGAKLATLAIETRRLYSDLRHRSEFDLLTDIHNRFSMEKQLDARIEAARESAGIFGLIYVDLDDFKQVNDLYGHHTGDLYLQEVAERMKRQLRPHDLLARLGGDEFAVLLPKVRNRAEVEEISERLEHCFDLPLILEGQTLQGAASFGIALYPEDSATRDGLLSAADAAMYVAKHSKRPMEEGLAESSRPELTSQNRA